MERNIYNNTQHDAHDNESSYSSSSSDSESDDDKMEAPCADHTPERMPDSNRIHNSYVFEKSPFRFSNENDQSLTARKYKTCHVLKSAMKFNK